MSGDLSRRAFTGTLAAAAVAPLLRADPPGPGAPTLDSGGPPASDLEAVARELTDAVRAQYGHRLGNDDMAAVGRQILANLKRAERLRALPLTNSDEPDFTYGAPRDPPR
jgi:hypothetical protein